MSSYDDDSSWGEVLFILVIAIFLVFVMVSCQNSNRDKCRDSGGSPIDQGRGVGVSCFYTDGRPPAQFNMER